MSGLYGNRGNTWYKVWDYHFIWSADGIHEYTKSFDRTKLSLIFQCFKTHWRRLMVFSCQDYVPAHPEQFFHTIISQKVNFLHHIQSESKLFSFCVFTIYEKLQPLAKSVSCVPLVSVHLCFYLCIRDVSFFPKAPVLVESLCIINHNYWGLFHSLKWGKDIISNTWLGCSTLN